MLNKKVYHAIRGNCSEERVGILTAHLSRLEEKIQGLSSPGKSSNDNQISPDATGDAVSSSEKTPGPLRQDLDDMSYQGIPSFETHSKEAGQILQSALANNPSQNLAASAAMKSLFDTSKGCTCEAFQHSMKMPPLAVVLNLVKVAKAYKELLTCWLPMPKVDSFVETCQKIYFPIDGYSLSEFMIFSYGSAFLLENVNMKTLVDYGIKTEEAEECLALCKRNAMAILEHMGLFLEPCLNNIQTLLLGSTFAIEENKPSMAWRFISVAARLCLDCGLNRLRDDPTDPLGNHKKMTFWMVYTIDKSLSLNFGLSYPELKDPSQWPMTIFTFNFARVQSQIYEHLYSARAQLQEPDVRERYARKIAKKVDDLIEQFVAIPIMEGTSSAEYLVDFKRSTIMFLYSTLTLTYRAVPSPDPNNPLRFAPECVATAKKNLRIHRDICASFENDTQAAWESYVNWNLLFCPFTPFIVILGTVMLDINPEEDLRLLSEIVDSLKNASSHVTGVKRMYKMCAIMYQAAKAFIEQRVIQAPPINQNEEQGNQDAFVEVNHTNFDGQHMSSAEMQQFQNDEYYNLAQFQNGPLNNDMSAIFENYLVGAPNIMDIFEADTTFTF
ncbi:hypothetical protein B0J14DRAFT_565206 [Halenospora varia]|nr:hypothetical protein B0J14DRAFT_565206 [Halenospora varia]